MENWVRQITMIMATQVNSFLASTRVSQNGMLLVLVAYITGVQRHNVVQLMESDLAFTMHVVVGVCMGCIDPANWVFQKFSLDETGGLYYTMQAIKS